MKQRLAYLLVLTCLATSDVDACSCSGMPETMAGIEVWLQRNDLVALVRIEEIVRRSWAEGDTEKSDSYVRATVVERFKGQAENSEIFVDLSSGSTCEAHFQVRDTYLVFAKGPNPHGRFTTSMCASGQYRTEVEGGDQHNLLLERIRGPIVSALREATK